MLGLKVSIEGIEYKRDRDIVKSIEFVGLAILHNISEHIFLIGQLRVVLEVIEDMLVHLFIRAILIIVALVALLPLQGKKRLLAVSGLFPILAS